MPINIIEGLYLLVRQLDWCVHELHHGVSTSCIKDLKPREDFFHKQYVWSNHIALGVNTTGLVAP